MFGNLCSVSKNLFSFHICCAWNFCTLNVSLLLPPQQKKTRCRLAFGRPVQRGSSEVWSFQSASSPNLGKLMDYIKIEQRLSPQQTQQQLGRVTQTQRTMIVPPIQQQLQRQLSQQNMTLASQQLHWDRRNKPVLMPRTIGRKLEKEKTIGDVKLETSNDSAADCKVAAPLVSQHHAQWQHQHQHQQQQQQQQQSVQMSHHSQSMPQFKQHPSLQLTQIQQQNLFSRDIVQMRTQPVKVEGFQELMGGDVNVKEADDEIGRTLMSPRK